MLPMAVARSFAGRVTKFQGEGAVLGIFVPIDNALHSIAFGTIQKTAEPIEMPFGGDEWAWPEEQCVTRG